MGAPSTPPGESNGCSAHTFFSCPFLALSLFPRFPPTHPVPSLPFLRSAFVPSLCCPASVVFCLPRLGSVCCLPPPSPRFLAFALCLLVVCSPCLFCLCCFPRFSVVGCGWLSLFPPSFPRPTCVCVGNPESKGISRGATAHLPMLPNEAMEDVVEEPVPALCKGSG